MKFLQHSAYALLLMTVAVSCNKENDVTIDDKTLKVNTFITETMKEVYLWTDKMPTNINYRQESDPKAYFDKLLYKAEDKWSFITDDYEGLIGSLSGQETTYGYSVAFGRFINSSNIFAVVQYVYPNSPAELAGLKRGDIFIKINGSAITDNNYLQFIYSNNITITLGEYDSGGISMDGIGTVTLTARPMQLNAVLIDTVINYQGRKIGYLFYTQYYESTTSLDNALLSFKADGITDLVLDLRYNPGGYVSTARHLCSALAPRTVVAQKEILITKHWNNLYQNHWTTNNEQGQLEERFDASLVTNNVNMDLQQLYVLTGRGTASASELTITGLQPYMNNITLIGGTTVGKYVASATLRSQKNGQVDSELSNWAIQPIIFAYANARGDSFKNGFVPDYDVEDDYIRNPMPLGDMQEALLAKALELITGVAPTSAKAAQHEPLPYRIVGTGFSRFDNFRGNAIEQLTTVGIEHGK